MLNQDIHRYVELQRSIGFKFRSQGLLLRSFVTFAEDHADRFIQTSRVIEWAGKAPSAPQRYNRLATVRCALALHAEETQHEVPPNLCSVASGSDVLCPTFIHRKRSPD